MLLLGGATASGKTAFAIELAHRYGAEIVGADSRQVYRGMPVGTAAPSEVQREGVAHHLIAFVDPYERYSAARFVVDAAAAINEIQARGKRAIVAGGTGFYLRALCGGVDLAAEPDPQLRARLLRESRTHPVDVLHAWLAVRDPERAAAICAHDAYRVVRALEVALAREAPGAPALAAAHLPAQRSTTPLPTLRATGIPFTKVALQVSSAELHERIAVRTDAMLTQGLLEEAERIGPAAIAADAVGYREALAFRSGCLTFDELRMLLERTTRRYAKRQLTWFRAEPDLVWIDPGDRDAIDFVAARIGWTPVGA